MKRKLWLLTLSSFFATLITGCATSVHPFGQDFLDMRGTPAAIEEFFTGINGISQTAKNDDVHTIDNHHALQREKVKVKGLSFKLGREADHAK